MHRAVDRVTVENLSKENPSKGGSLILKCKNFMICIFEINNIDSCMAVARSIGKLSNLSKSFTDLIYSLFVDLLIYC